MPFTVLPSNFPSETMTASPPVHMPILGLWEKISFISFQKISSTPRHWFLSLTLLRPVYLIANWAFCWPSLWWCELSEPFILLALPTKSSQGNRPLFWWPGSLEDSLNEPPGFMLLERLFTRTWHHLIFTAAP